MKRNYLTPSSLGFHICVLIAAITFPLFSSEGRAESLVGGSIRESTVWTADRSPYILDSNLVIEKGSILTILPGVRVYIKEGSFPAIIVRGALTVAGTSSDTIYFGSRDKKTAPSQIWRGLVFSDSSQHSELRYVTVVAALGGIQIDNSAVDIENSLIQECGTGISIKGHDIVSTVRGNQIIQNNIGLDIYDSAKPLITENIFRENRIAIIVNSANPSIYRNGFSDNVEDTVSNASETIKLSGSNFGIGSKHEQIMANAANEPVQQYQLSITNNINCDTTWTVADNPVLISSTIHVSAGVTLTIQPGVVVKLGMGGNAALVIDGRLISEGIVENPIYFTSVRDDLVGGDSNGDGNATVPGVGDWNSLQFTQSSTGSSLLNVIIRYATNGTDITNSSPSIASSTFSNNSSTGLYISGSNAMPQITSSTIGNNGTGIRVESGAMPQIQNSVFSYNTTGLSMSASTALVTDNSLVENGTAVSSDFNSAGGISNNTLSVTAGAGRVGGILVNSGTLISDATWSQLDMPYVISGNTGISIAPGVTLNISPGVVVKLGLGIAQIQVYGALMVNGTATQKVIFTSYQDDTVGGDTNGDGSASAPAPGDWGEIYFASTASGTLSNMIVRYGGRGYGGIHIENCSPSISNSTISNNGNNGIYISGSNAKPQITSSTIGNNGTGIVVDLGAAPQITSSTIDNNRAGIEVRRGAMPQIQNSVFSYNATGLSISSSTPLVTGNAFVENGTAVSSDLNSAGGISNNTLSVTAGAGRIGGILVNSGTLTSDATWSQLGMPYVIYGDTGISIAPGVTLNISPGVVVKLGLGIAQIQVYGALMVNGTATQKVIFTSYQDDTVGGDTNGDGSASAPAPGDWGEIYFASTASGTLSNMIVRYGGRGYGGIHIENCSPSISNSTISNNGNNGIYISGSNAMPQITSSTIGNNGTGIVVDLGAAPQITSSTIGNNRTGIEVVRGSMPQIQNSVFSYNTTGLSMSASTALVTDNSLVENGTAVSSDFNSAGGISNNTLSVTAGAGRVGGILVNSGTLISDATWSQLGMPYVIYGDTGISIAPGVTLNISPGVVVKLGLGIAQIQVYGALMVNGTATQKVIFTSYQDDTVGGDTNGDGSASAPAPGDWGEIYFASTASGTLSNMIVRYGGRGYGGIHIENCSPSISNSTISNNGNNGIYISGSNAKPQITSSTIGNNGTGIVVDLGAAPQITSSTIDNNRAGIEVRRGAMPQIQNSVFSYNATGLSISSSTPLVTGNAFVENGTAVSSDLNSAGGISNNTLSVTAGAGRIGGILVNGGTLISDATWSQLSMPYVISGNTAIAIAQGVTLNLSPGVVVKLGLGIAQIQVDGALVVNGTATQKVIFTSYQDDTAGGDTNGDGSASTPAPGDWQRIYFTSTASGSLSNMIVRYGGKPFYARDGIYIEDCSPSISNSTISNNEGNGIHISGSNAKPLITSSTISNNGTGILVQSGAEPQVVQNNSFINNGLAMTVAPSALTGVSNNSVSIEPGSGQLPYIQVGGPLDSDVTWGEFGMPYVITGADVIVNLGATLTLSAGVVVKFDTGRSIAVNGALVANATALKKIVFTSLRDDAVVGDSNGDGNATVPASANWAGVNFSIGSTGALANVVLRYSANGISVTNSSPSIGYSTISQNGYGVYVTGSLAKPVISSNRIINNGTGIYSRSAALPTIYVNAIQGNGAGVTNADPSVTIHAENNFWGAANGPSGAGSGSGDSVSQYVIFSPFQGFDANPPPADQPYLSTSPNAILFGQVAAGNVSRSFLLIQNTGTTPLTINRIASTGQPFGVENVPQLPITIGSYSSLVLSVTFTPVETGVFPGTISILSDWAASPTQVTLSGSCATGIVPPPIISSTSPPSTTQGSTLNAFVVYGTNFDPAATVGFSGQGISVVSYLMRLPTAIVATIAVDPNAPLGTRDVIVTNSDMRIGVRAGALTVGPASRLSIGSVTPNHGGNKGQITVNIVGEGFDPAALVFLDGPGSKIVGSWTAVSSTGSYLTTMFDLSGVTSGLWNLTVSNPSGTSFKLPRAFSIEDGGAPQIWVNIIGPSVVSPGQQNTFYVIYGNSGNVDAVAVPIVVGGIPAGAIWSLGIEFSQPPDLPGEEPTDWSAVPIAVQEGDTTSIPLELLRVAPGATGVIPIRITANSSFNLNVKRTQDLLCHGFGCAAAIAKLMSIFTGNPELMPFINAVGCLVSDVCAKLDADRESGGVLPLNWQTFKLLKSCLGPGLDPILPEWIKVIDKITSALLSCIQFINDIFPVGVVQPSGGRSHDPNDKFGAQGAGSSSFVRGDVPLPYLVVFENDALATAPAHEIVITDQLRPDLVDLTTFSLGPISFGDALVVPPARLNQYTTDVDLRPANNLIVRINALVDTTTGLATWRLVSLDPATMLPPSDWRVGFLPPNITSPEGQGGVVFTVSPKPNLPTGTEIRNTATIVFDTNAPINTPEWLNTIDSTRPTSSVSPLATTQANADFPVLWTGTDVGAGIESYDIYVSNNGAPFTTWQTQTSATQATYQGIAGHRYGFYSIARDLAGNVESSKASAEATTTMFSDAIPPTTNATPSPQPNSSGWNNSNVEVTLTATDNTAGSGVKQIQYSLAGAQSSGSQIMFANSATFTVSTEGITNLVYFAVDTVGNTEQEKTLTIQIDKTAPQLTCQEDMTIEATSAAGAVATYPAAIAMDSLSTPTITYSTPSGSTFPFGTTTITVTAKDDAGNTSMCTFKVIVRDTTAPAINCPTDITVEANSASGAVVTYPPVTATEGVSTPTVTYSHPSGSAFPLGTTTVTVTATDAAGNTSTCTFKVIVRDTTAPTLSCPSDITVEARSANGAVVTYPPVTATDGVSTPTVTYSTPSGSTFPLGTTTVTVAAKDAEGNTSTCSFKIIVRDTTAPSLNFPADITVEATSANGAIVTYPPVIATDGISTPTVTYSHPSGSTFPLGTTTVTITATDAAGNTSTCTFKVVVRDTTAPAINCPTDITVEATSASGAVVTYPPVTATDGVSTPTVTYSHPSGSTFPLGTTTVTVTATDAAGNTSTCTFKVVVRDTTAPAINCPTDITVEATSANGAVVTYPPVTATDGISTPTVTYSHPSGSTFPLGTTTVTVTAKDAEGNTSTCSFKIFVRDTTAPALNCPTDITVEATSANGTVVTYPPVTATDGISTPTVTYSHPSGSTFPLGSTTVTVTATDAAGNTSTCTFKVVVRDTTAPSLNCPADITAEATSANGAVVTYPPATATDAVSTPTVTYSNPSGSVFPLGITTVKVTAKDAAGNTSTCTFKVNVRDITPPVVSAPASIRIPSTEASGARGSSSAVLAGFIAAGSATDVVDPAPQRLPSQIAGSDININTLFTVGTTPVTFRFMDASGNIGTAVSNTTVLPLGDLNGDGKVDCQDISIVKASFGKRRGQSGFDPRADTNNDGVVDVRDLAYVSQKLPAGLKCP